jgi:hypothetical protein
VQFGLGDGAERPAPAAMRIEDVPSKEPNFMERLQTAAKAKKARLEMLHVALPGACNARQPLYVAAWWWAKRYCSPR